MPKFLLKYQAAVIKEIPIDKTPITIGRKPDNDIVIDSMAVSGHHAKVILQGATYVVEDTQSTNGIFVNEKKIMTSALKHNDNILIGQHTLTFVHPESVAPQAGAQQAVDADATVVLTPQSLAAAKAAAQSPSGPAAPQSAPAPAQRIEVIGNLRVIEGKMDQNEFQLTSLLTYIGKSETAAIKIKGLFAPDIAALISKRPTGYLITAVKDGYPKLNNKPLSGQSDLNDGDIVEVGGIKLLFQLKAK